MSDIIPRNPISAPQMLADALLRSVGGTNAQLRVTGGNPDTGTSELGLVATTFSQVVLCPVLLRKLRPDWKSDGTHRWELLVSAASVEQQVSALELPSAQALFDLTLAVTISAQDYLIESVACNEAFGQIYLYRLLLRQTKPQAV